MDRLCGDSISSFIWDVKETQEKLQQMQQKIDQISKSFFKIFKVLGGLWDCESKNLSFQALLLLQDSPY